MLRGLAADELALLERILTRWYEAGHREGTHPELSELEAGDVDADSNTLIATQDEWRQYERLHSVLETLQRHHVQGSREIPARPPNNRTRTRKNR